MVPILVLGWWLVVQSRVQAQPGPYLSLSPSHEVALGDKVTLQCHTPRQGGRAILHKEGVRHPLQYQDRVQGAAEFPITAVRREDAGRYWCQYEMEGEPPEKSEHVELVLRASPDAMQARSVPAQGSPKPNTTGPHPPATGSSCPSTSRGEDLGRGATNPLCMGSQTPVEDPGGSGGLTDFTLGNTVRLGLGAGLLILLMLLVAEALHSRRRKGQGL
nr:PREDICTED: immunoglobulin superfamily member 1-like isoform X1 [Apteryx mantelli mantelli]